MPNSLRLTRGHLRYLAAMERGGTPVIFIMTIIPIFVNFAWTIIYFKERTDDVFSYGPCQYNSSTVYATPFFVTNRGEELWGAQVVFTLLTVFVWAPYRYLRPRASRYVLRNIMLSFVDFVTLMPFLLSLVFPPAYVSYVPTFLRVWVVKYEALSLLSPDQTIKYLVVSLAMDILSITISVIGAFEWSVNNFPLDPIASSGLVSTSGIPHYPCLNFFDSLYWFLVTFATVGYGDIVPTNIISRMLVIFFIVLFLLLLPEFINKALAIVRSYADLKDARFTKAKKQDFIVVDGRFDYRHALRATAVLQPKYFTEELIVSYIVVVTKEAADLEELVKLRDARMEDYTRLVLLEGSLDVPDTVRRSGANRAKSIYLLPDCLEHIPYPTAHHRDRIGLREATEQTREFCTRRDFSTIRRLWAVQRALPNIPIRTVLMHRSNLNLVESRPLAPERLNSSVSHGQAQLLLCSCSTIEALCVDHFEQRVAAASALVPAFGTVLTMMALGGSCDHKSLEEYEAEAMTLAAIDRVYESQPDLLHAVSTLDRVDSAGKSVRSLVVRAKRMSGEDDEQYIKSFRHSLICIRFKGAVQATLGRVCRHAFEARVLIMGFIASRHGCSHANFRTEKIMTAHSCLVEPEDWIVCFGTSHHIDILRRAAFWQIREAVEAAARLNPLSATDSPASLPIDRSISLALLREGEHEHAQLSDRYIFSESKRFHDVHLRDARGPAEPQALDGGNGTPVPAGSLSDSTSDEEDRSAPMEGTAPSSTRISGSLRPSASLRTRLTDHIIVSSASHDDYVFFVRKLRDRALGIDRSIPILLFDSKPPNKFRWSEIAVFDNVYFLQGRSFVIDDLRRAGFDKARCLVLISDFHMQFEGEFSGTTTPACDRDHLIAEKVATRLKKELGCKTRIITHLVREENCDFVSLSRSRTIDFERPLAGKPSTEAVKKRRALASLARLVESAWSPALKSSFIAGECWSPSCFPLLFYAAESKGNWVSSFLEALIDSAGQRGGLKLVSVPRTCVTYEDAVLHFLGLGKGLVIGIFRNFSGVEAQSSTVFRGCILFPENHVGVSVLDMLFVLTTAEPEDIA